MFGSTDLTTHRSRAAILRRQEAPYERLHDAVPWRDSDERVLKALGSRPPEPMEVRVDQPIGSVLSRREACEPCAPLLCGLSILVDDDPHQTVANVRLEQVGCLFVQLVY